MVGATTHHHHQLKNKTTTTPTLENAPMTTEALQKLIPILEKTDSNWMGQLERFSYYVARQIGFSDPSECPILCKLANEYLKKNEGCESVIFEYLASHPDVESLYVKLIEELERCILSYFAFHWSYSSDLVAQVLGGEDSHKKTKLKNLVLAATRKQRFERTVKNLKVTRVFSTLVEEMKAIGGKPTPSSNGHVESKCTEVMVPVAHNKRSPVLLLMGGGMGAGKSTVLKDLLKESFWSEAEAEGNVVVVEADAFKETDVIYRALSSSGHHGDMLQTAELVHQSSTDAASSLLVTALNEGRDVIMDGTLAWAPFVEQTITMARNVHNHRYRMGVGYKEADDGSIIEKYWEEVDDEKEAKQPEGRKPYRIELVGVVCDAYLAVVRGIRRAIIVGRAVRVKSQLTSHKRFATAFPTYCDLADSAKLYCTNATCGAPRLIGWKNGPNKLLVDPEEINCLEVLRCLNEDADSIYELHNDESRPNPSPYNKPGSAWKDIVLLPTRPEVQHQLKAAIQKAEVITTQ